MRLQNASLGTGVDNFRYNENKHSVADVSRNFLGIEGPEVRQKTRS
jgi:hypothetical protein